jgi:hypothetical protein
MRYGPLKIASTVFWVGVTVFFFWRFSLDGDRTAFWFGCLFLLLTALRVYLLYREWRGRTSAKLPKE